MAKEILINVEAREKRVAVTQDGRLDEFFVERPEEKTIVGNIYKGKIDAVIPSIGGAFVDIGLPKKGFLYISEIESYFDSLDGEEFNSCGIAVPKPDKGKEAKATILNSIKKGQEILVQVVKESFGTKGPRLTCHVGIAGRYLVLMPQERQIGVSRRIDDEDERKRLKQTLSELKFSKDVGFIVRTAASGKTKQEIIRDAAFLYKLWKRLERAIRRQKAPALSYEEYDLTLRMIRDSFTDDVERLIVDSKPEYYRIQRFMKTFMRYLSRKVEFYEGQDLFLEKNIEKQISQTFESKVYLKSKAYLIIEPTEGLVVIDVNSGGYKKNMVQEEAAFKINCEAAIEAIHQLKLRDLGGIIVIDFIDMEKEGHRREVFNVLRQELNKDKAKYDILGISKFGLVEMTRERVHNTVQTLALQPCSYCQGRGKVKSPLTMSITALKEVKRYLHEKQSKEVTVTLHPLVAEEVLKDKESVRMTERRFRTKINIVSNPAFHIENVTIV